MNKIETAHSLEEANDLELLGYKLFSTEIIRRYSKNEHSFSTEATMDLIVYIMVKKDSFLNKIF